MSAEDFLPERKSLSSLKRTVQKCQGCKLYRHATQAVFGEGQKESKLILIGEQPGNEEDLQGKPFVGPAGRVLAEVLANAGIDRDDVYVTNAVKHFKWEPRGVRRLHKKPSSREIQACHPWLDSELDLIRPEGVICLGAVAAQAMLGRSFRITAQRGTKINLDGADFWVIATWHPSAILRNPDRDNRHCMRSEMEADLRKAANFLIHTRTTS